MKHWWWLNLLMLLGLALGLATGVGAQTPRVVVAQVQGAIDPATARYITGALRTAEADDAYAFILQIDTPGGLDSSMREIVQAMTRSPLPVIVYVGPSGARAASAGVFIAYAADVIAMAPGTNIGAAHPVTLGGGDIPSTEADKVTNDAVAYVRALAQASGHNPDWAADAVRQSVSATAEDAVKLKVADLIAADLNDLLRQLDGRTINQQGRTVTLSTGGLALQTLPMSFPEQFVHTLINPAITYLLLAVAVWSFIAELSAPGISVPGIIGLVCLTLFAVSASIIPINWAGALLILTSLIFFVLDIKAPTHGVLTAGGITAFVLGSLLLFRPVGPFAPSALPQAEVWRAPLALIAVVAGITALLLGGATVMGVRAQRLAPEMGPQTLAGATGRVTSAGPEGVTAQVRGELWSARLADDEAPLARGEAIQVVAMDGLTLIVRRVS